MPLTTLPQDQKLKRINGLLSRLFVSNINQNQPEAIRVHGMKINESQKESIAIYFEKRLEAFYSNQTVSVAFPSIQAFYIFQAEEVERMVTKIIENLEYLVHKESATVITHDTSLKEMITHWDSPRFTKAQNKQLVDSMLDAHEKLKISFPDSLKAVKIDRDDRSLLTFRDILLAISDPLLKDVAIFDWKLFHFCTPSHEWLTKIHDCFMDNENILRGIQSPTYFLEGYKKIQEDLFNFGLVEEEIKRLAMTWRDNCSRYRQIPGVAHSVNILLTNNVDVDYLTLRLNELMAHEKDKAGAPVSMVEVRRLTISPLIALESLLNDSAPLPLDKAPMSIADMREQYQTEAEFKKTFSILYKIVLMSGSAFDHKMPEISLEDFSRILFHGRDFQRVAKNYDNGKYVSGALTKDDLLLLMYLQVKEVDRYIRGNREEFDRLCDDQGLEKSLKIEEEIKKNPDIDFEALKKLPTITKAPMRLTTGANATAASSSNQAGMRASQH